MRPVPASRIIATMLLLSAAGESRGIEMFTFFGDGSRIGLPSLEVPVEAYPGIPLRSDRLRARRRAMRMGPSATAAGMPPAGPRGITVRSMPTGTATPRSMTRPAQASPESRDEVPVPPEPAAEEIPSGPLTDR